MYICISGSMVDIWLLSLGGCCKQVSLLESPEI